MPLKIEDRLGHTTYDYFVLLIFTRYFFVQFLWVPIPRGNGPDSEDADRAEWALVGRVVQCHGDGPWVIEYLNPANDPRKKK